MIARAAVFALRRALAPALLVYAAVIAWAAWSAWPAGEPADGTLGRAGVWSALVGLVAPVLVFRAATLLPGWRRREIDWIAGTPRGRASWLAAAWLGTAALALALVAGAFALGELRARGAGDAWRLAGTLAAPPVALVESDLPVRWSVADVAASGGRLRAELALAGGGSAAQVRFAARRAGATAETRAVLGMRTRVDVALPEGAGPLELELERVGDGAVVVLAGDGVELLEPASGGGAVGAALALRALAWCAAALALALGFSAWVSAASAASIAVALWLPAWLARSPPSWLPGGDWFAALELAGGGVAAPAPALASWLVAALALALGLFLGGAPRWSRTP